MPASRGQGSSASLELKLYSYQCLALLLWGDVVSPKNSYAGSGVPCGTAARETFKSGAQQWPVGQLGFPQKMDSGALAYCFRVFFGTGD